MASERFFRSVTQAFLVDGTSKGVVRVTTAHGFKVKADVVIRSSSQQPLTLEIKRIPNATTIEVGPKGPDMDVRADLSAYLVADGASIQQPRQKRNSIGPGEMDRATYEEEPTVARRTILVDEFGDLVSDANPLPVTSDAQPSPLTSESAGSITDGSFTEIFRFTSTSDNTKIIYIESTVSTAATVRVLIDGLVARELRTSSLERNACFEFHVGRPLLTGQVVSVEAQVDRVIHPTYETFTAMEGYVS